MERRQQPRTKISRPVYFICTDSNGRETLQDIAVAKDVSDGGMLIETAGPINTMDIRILASTSDGRRMAINGIVIYSMPTAENKYRTGIGFRGSPGETHDFVALITGTSG